MLFETARTEQEVFDDPERLCASPGYTHVLALLSFRDNLVLHSGELTSEALAASYAPQATIRIEFSTLLGLMLKHPIDFDLPSPTEMQRLIDGTGGFTLGACFSKRNVGVRPEGQCSILAIEAEVEAPVPTAARGYEQEHASLVAKFVGLIRWLRTRHGHS